MAERDDVGVFVVAAVGENVLVSVGEALHVAVVEAVGGTEADTLDVPDSVATTVVELV